MLWCTAEITCGFFVACAPILPRVARETPGMRRLFGSSASRGTADAIASGNLQLGIQTIGGTGGPPRHTRGSKPGHYDQLDDDGLPMDDLKTASDSTEHLRGPPSPGGTQGSGGNAAAGGIVRTTHVTVTTGARDPESYESSNNVTPSWMRQ